MAASRGSEIELSPMYSKHKIENNDTVAIVEAISKLKKDVEMMQDTAKALSSSIVHLQSRLDIERE